jgi:hypothetical protein
MKLYDTYRDRSAEVFVWLIPGGSVCRSYRQGCRVAAFAVQMTLRDQYALGCAEDESFDWCQYSPAADTEADRVSTALARGHMRARLLDAVHIGRAVLLPCGSLGSCRR